jgi:hypothetical protein
MRHALVLAFVLFAASASADQWSKGWYVYGASVPETSAPTELGADVYTGANDYPVLILRKLPSACTPGPYVSCNPSVYVPVTPFDLRVFDSLELALPHYFVSRSKHRDAWLVTFSNDTTAVITRRP